MDQIISEKAASVLDFLEQLEAINKMISQHQDDTFMREQYIHKKKQIALELEGCLEYFDMSPKDLAA
ncbi:MAG: hypothetical protein AAF824_20865 [Bacteroidota bacterium]